MSDPGPRSDAQGGDRRRLEAELADLGERPLVSVVMPTYESAPGLLDEAVGSVLDQAYPDWELRIVDDGSSDPQVRTAIERSCARDQRIKALFLERNGGISAATNRGLEECRGELVAFLDHDDRLAPEALLRVAREFTEHPRAEVVYTDQDKLTPQGERAEPFLKPDWSPVYALGVMYVGHLLCVRRDLLERAGGFDPAFDGVQDFELLLRLSEQAREIRHVPEILYHWRAIPGSVAAGEGEKPGIDALQAEAVSSHLKRRTVPAGADPHPTFPHRARLVADSEWPVPPVSIVIAQSGERERLGRCIESVLDASRGEAPELVVVADPDAGGAPEGEDGLLWTDREPGPFHRAAANNLGALRARGELLVFLSDEIEIARTDWLRDLALLATMPAAGPVGPLLCDPAGDVVQAGWVIGLDDPARPAMKGLDAGADGHYGALSCPREVSAVSSECMMIERGLFAELDGFEDAYRTGFEDFDLCQRAMDLGRAPIYTPQPSVVSHRTPAERRSAFDVVDRALFVDLFYERLLAGDRFYNPGFRRDLANFEPAAPR